MAQLHIDEKRCKGCELCVSVCPNSVLKMTKEAFNPRGFHYAEVVKPEACIFCGRCALMCPDMAIEIKN